MKKVFKKSLSCLLAAILCVSLFVAAVPASAVAPTYSTNDIEAKAGDPVNIDFTVSNFINVKGALIRFNLPSAIGSVESVKLNGEDFEAFNPDTGTGYYQIGQEGDVYYVKFLSLFGADLGELDSMETLTFNIAATVKADAAAKAYEYPEPVFSVTENGETLVDVTGTFGNFEVVEDAPVGPIYDESLASALFQTQMSISNKFGFYFTLFFNGIPYDDFEFVVSKNEIDIYTYNYTGEIVSKTYTKNTCDSDSYPGSHLYYITYDDIFLYEMSAPITYTLYVTKDGVTRYYTFAENSLSNIANAHYQKVYQSNPVETSLVVDMLNLGTEAQHYFARKGDNVLDKFDDPNASVNQDFATDYGELETVDGTGNSPEILKPQIALGSAPSLYYTFYVADCKVPSDLTFTATYDSKFTGEPITRSVNGADLDAAEKKFGEIAGMYYFYFDKTYLFDADKTVTFTVSHTDGRSWSYVTSIESLLASYVEEESDEQASYRAIAAFAASARNYWPNY